MFYKNFKTLCLILLLTGFLLIPTYIVNAQLGPKTTTMGNQNDDVFHFLGSIGIGNAVVNNPDARLDIRPELHQKGMVIRSANDEDPFTILHSSGNPVRFIINNEGTVTAGNIPWERVTALPDSCADGQFITGLDPVSCGIPDGGGGTLETYWSLLGDNVYRDEGFVGIGLNNPNRHLHIYDTALNAEINLQSQSGVNAHWALYNNRDDNSFRLWGNGNWITVLRTGQVGIGSGAVDPTRQLHVAGDMRLTGHFYDVANLSGSNGQVLTRTSSGPRWLAFSAPGDNLGSHIAERNIGLGDFFISYKGEGQNEGIQFLEEGRLLNFNTRICLFEDCIDRWPSPGGSNWLVSGSNVYRSSGSVGVGVSSPSTKLHLYDSGSGPIVSLSGQNTNYRGLALRTTAGAEQWFYGSNDSNNFVVRRSGSSNDLVINSSGSIGVGTDNPQEKLHVAGTIRTALSGSGNRCLYVTPNGNIAAKSEDCGTVAGGGDNLGNHIATQNITLATHYISRTGTDAGLSFDTSNNATFSGLVSLGAQASTTSHAVRADRTITAGTGLTGGGNLTANRTINLQYPTKACPAGQVMESFNIGSSASPVCVPAGSGSNWLVSGSNVYRLSGNVGIGTDSPITKLHLYDNASGPIVSLSGQNTNYRGLTLRTTAGTEQWFYGSNTANNFVIRRSGISDDLVVNASGNVGIGTDNPGDLLHVNGIIRLPGSEGNDYQIRGGGNVLTGVVVKAVTNPAGDMPIFAVESSGIATRFGVTQAVGTWARDGFWVGTYDTGTLTRDVGVLRSVNDLQLFAGSAEQVRVTGDGKVGIGVTSPNKQLHIYKTSGDNPEINLQGSAVVDSHWAIYNERSNNSLRFWGGDNHFNILRTGQVGIGTDSPQETLHVAGTIRTALSGSGNRCLYVTPNGNIAAKSEDCGTVAGGGDNLGNHIATQNLNMSGYNVAIQAGYFSRTGTDAGLSFDTSNNATFSGRITLGTQATATSHAVRADRLINTGAGSGLTGGGNLTANLDLRLTNTGVTGGTYGNASNVPVITVDAQGRITSASTATITAGGLNGSGTAGYLSRWTSATTLGNGSIYDDGGKVSIGTTTPGGQLHIYHASSGPIISLAGATNNYRGSSIRNTVGAEQWFYGANNSNNFVVRRFGANDDLVINFNGDVGVGVSAPHAKLEVGGNLLVANPGTLRVVALGDGASNQVVMVDRDGVFSATSTASWQLPSGTSGQTMRHNGTNWLANSNLYNDGNNVGIGTASPDAKLDVFGNVRIRQGLEVGYQDTMTTIDMAGGYLELGSTIFSSPSYLSFFSSNNTFAFGSTNGAMPMLVGIGNFGGLSPQANLHIKATNNTEGLKIVSSNYSPLSVRNTADTADLFRVNEIGSAKLVGSLSVGGTHDPVGRLDVRTPSGADYLVAAQIVNTRNSTNNSGLIINTAVTNSGAYILDAQSGGTSRLRVRSDGRIGIGTIYPEANLDIAGTLRVSYGANLAVSSSNVGIGTASPSAKLQVQPGTGVEGLRIISSNHSPVIIRNSTDSVDLFRVNQAGQTTIAGNVGIGTASPSSRLEVRGSGSSELLRINSDSGNSGIRILSGGTSRGYFWWDGNALGVGTGVTISSIMFRGGNVGIGTSTPSQKLDVNGNVRGVSFIYTSDERLKENIKPLNNSLEKILKIRGVNFDWRDGQDNQIGFIAQEIEPVIPELITGEEDDYKGVLYGNLTALLVEAIKEQQVQINTLEQRLSEIESAK